MRFEGSKDDLRRTLDQYQKQARLLSLAATAIMNHLVEWDGDTGTSEFYKIRILRRKLLDMSLPVVTEVEEIK